MSPIRYHVAPRPLKRPVKGRTHTFKSYPWQPLCAGEQGYDQAFFEQVPMNWKGFAMTIPDGSRVVMIGPMGKGLTGQTSVLTQEILDYSYFQILDWS